MAAPPMNGCELLVGTGKPEVAATPVPTTVPFKYPGDEPVGATAGRPLTGLTSTRLLDELAAGTALKRTLGTTAVERDVDEALSIIVLMLVL